MDSGIVAISHGCTGVAAHTCGLFHDDQAVDVMNVLSTGSDGTIELLYMQVNERSLNNTQSGPSMPVVQNFIRAEMLPSVYLIRPCEGGGSIIHVVDHMDLEVQTALSFVVW
ncbi:START domain containing protein [Trema orientale]|uniref:START domain containing protein n=1 Tax=Trema orientale TaxID=63057 RepID=A0A2P5EP03_TREOI|nr:START domain containing protein [Trema orientale]